MTELLVGLDGDDEQQGGGLRRRRRRPRHGPRPDTVDPRRTCRRSGRPGAEMPADALLEAAVAAVSGAGERAGRAGGRSRRHEHGRVGVLLDARGRPVVPVIAWHDARDLPQVTQFGRDIGADRFSTRTGLPLRSQWSMTKHRWQLETDPATARGVRRLSVAEWVVKGMGGDEASDVSLASRTGWLDLTARGWWTEALDWSGASEGLFPPLVTSGTALGRVSADLGVPRLAVPSSRPPAMITRQQRWVRRPQAQATSSTHAARRRPSFVPCLLASRRRVSRSSPRAASRLAGTSSTEDGRCWVRPRGSHPAASPVRPRR